MSTFGDEINAVQTSDLLYLKKELMNTNTNITISMPYRSRHGSKTTVYLNGNSYDGCDKLVTGLNEILITKITAQ